MYRFCSLFTGRPSVSATLGFLLVLRFGDFSVMARFGQNPEAERAFYHAYGAAMANWASIEYELSRCFVQITRLPDDLGTAIFFSARSFLGRADMLAECIPFVRDVPTAKRFLLDALARARSWQSTRNSLAHEQHNLVFQPGRAPFMAVAPLRGQHIGTEQLSAVSESFFCLHQIIQASRGRLRIVREPELCAEALAQVPADALQGEGTHSRVAPLLRRIQACDD